MDVFLTLVLKIAPLYVVIGMGYVAGRYLHAKKETVAPLLLYLIAPVIVFNGVVTTSLTVSTLSLPIVFFVVASILCLLFYTLSSFVWQDSTRNLMGFIGGSGNVGYFGLPVAVAIFPPESIGLMVLGILGIILFENSLGFFITARGHHTVSESIGKVLRLPALYAFFLGVVINLSGVVLGPIYTETITSFRGAYTILGMMMIGLGLADIKSYAIDYRFLGMAFFSKFIVWPAVIGAIIWIDMYLLHLYTPDIHAVMILLSIVPLAANSVTFATQLHAQPEKAALAVLLSTIFALIYIPLMALFFLQG